MTNPMAKKMPTTLPTQSVTLLPHSVLSPNNTLEVIMTNPMLAQCVYLEMIVTNPKAEKMTAKLLPHSVLSQNNTLEMIVTNPMLAQCVCLETIMTNPKAEKMTAKLPTQSVPMILMNPMMPSSMPKLMPSS